MFFVSHDECVNICTFRGWNIDIQGRHPVLPPKGVNSISFMVPPEREKLTVFCRAFAEIIPTDVGDNCLLWLMHWQDWGERANYHLYYRLRQSYSNYEQIHQSPGHLFLSHETNDLVTFIELALLFGWDFQLQMEGGDWGAYHDDELIIIYSNQDTLLDIAKTALAHRKIKVCEDT